VSLEDDSKVHHQTSLLAYAAAAGTVPLAFDPGTQWSYSISSDVLGAVIEKVSGMPFEHFLETKIFHPLGMIDTGFTHPPREPGSLSRCFCALGAARGAIASAK
jgi:CubicO group peptidase (beta-lactamase class C family)